MDALRLLGVRSGARRDRLHTLSRPLTKNSERVEREGLSLLPSSQVRADARKESIKTLLALADQLVCHATSILDTSIEIVNTTQDLWRTK